MAHEIYALINDGVVVNVIVGNYSDCNAIAKETYGGDAFAIDVTNIPAQINDTYNNGVFTRKVGKETLTIEPVLTETQKIDQLMILNAELRAELDTVSLAVLDLVKGG